MDKVMLEEASHHFVHLLNITPSRSLGNITPNEAAYGVVPDVSKLRMFGCVAFSTLPHPKKLDYKAVRATNLGHICYGKYRLLLPGPDYKIFVATSVKFDEQVFDFAADAVKEVTGIRNTTGGDDIISDDMRLLADDDEDEDEYAKGSKAALPVDAQSSDNHAGDVNGKEVKEVEEIRRYSFRNRTQTSAWNLSAHVTHTPDSPTISSALASTNKDKWLENIDKELSSLEDAGTWTMVPHQPGMNILRSHLVLKAKRDTAGAIIKYKARLVAGGDAQVHGLDLDQLYAPVADFTVVRVIFSIAARENRVVHSLDVSNAFVRAPLAEVVYVRPPKILADRFGSKTMKLNKALYGLKQAPLSWHLYLEKMFDTVKIIKSPTPCLYAYNNCTIVVYVDDLIISGPNVEEVTELKNIIKGLFVCTDAGAMNEYLGVLFERRDHDAFVLSQRQYFLNVLQRFGMEDCKPCATPCMPRKTIDEASTDMIFTTFSFREAVGNLLYLETHTHLDISLTAEMMGCAMAAPSAQDVVAVKRLMRYLSGTRDYGLVLNGTGESTLIAYSDADWGGDVDRKLTSGALHYFGEDLVHWTRKKQGCVALSTADAEYVTASSCAQDVI
jgi:Reverse transcriptase (RNA-dependent DNA polymerase)